MSDEVPHEGATVRYGVRAVHGRSSSLPRIPLPVRYATLAALAILPVAPLIARAQQPDGASARARVVARMMRGTVVLDGRLDDSAWAGADSIPGLRQREPREGEPGSERTVVKVLRDTNALYVGIRAYDRDPTAIVRHAVPP